LKETIMKKHFMLLSLTFSTLLLAQPARAKEPPLGVGTEPPAGVYHFPVDVSNVWWNPGCGVEPETGPTCRSGLFMTYFLSAIDVSLDYALEYVDNTTHTITIVVDSPSDTWDHPPLPVELQTIQLQSDELELFTDYAVEVFNQYRPIWTGSIRTDLAK